MDISQDDLSRMLAECASEAVAATYAAIAEQEAAREAQRQAAEAEASAAAKAALLAAQEAEGVRWALSLFGGLSSAILAVSELERLAHETRPVRMAMFDPDGVYLGVKEGRADMIEPPADHVAALPDWAKPPVITYVEWREEFDALHQAALAR